MNTPLILISIFFSLNCPWSDSNRAITNSNNNSLPKKSEERADTVVKRKADSTLLLKIAGEILMTIKKREYAKLASFVHPEYGVLFSPYANIDTSGSRILSSTGIIQLAKQNKRINWYSSWDANPEFLTIDQYIKKFVYDVDFINAPVKSVNKFHSQGTDLNNIAEVYPTCDVVEFYFPGFEAKYGGMDFRGLRLVLKLYNKKPYLVAIVHDEWTP